MTSSSNSISKSSSIAHDLWLVRTVDNRLDGPFAKAELCRLVEAGELGPQDEVCRAGHYWISLHEQQEVMEQLGIRPQFQKTKGAPGSEEEITETQTEVNEVIETQKAQKTDEVNLGQGAEAVPPDSGADIPDMPDETEFAGTAVIRRAQKPLGAKKPTPTGPLKISVRGISRMERPSIWRGAAWVLILAAGVLIYSVLKILRG